QASLTDPAKESALWSLDDGVILKRLTNPKEATILAYSLEALPTGKHYKIRVYGDITGENTVTTPDMIEKINNAVSNSDNLASTGGVFRFIGTRYHYNTTTIPIAS